MRDAQTGLFWQAAICEWAASHPKSLEPRGANARMPFTVLLIDDNAIQAATRQTILKRAGYFVIPVLNPQRALEQFQANDFPSPIDLVMTDHVMPGMTGAEFVREFRKLHTDIPVLVISGMEEAQDEYRDLDVTFRLKPLLPDNLLASVDRMLHSAHS